MRGEWIWASERALLRTFDGDAEQANAKARSLFEALRGSTPPGIVQLVPGARSLLVELDVDAELDEELERALAVDSPPASRPGHAHTIAVTYDGQDLEEVGRATGLGADEVVRLHASARYTVALIGFSPGFPYLLGLPEPLHVARLATPRTRVPAGSVAIAGSFAGIYPRATPGGWRLLGRTDAPVFDPDREPPALLQPGDEVRFMPA